MLALMVVRGRIVEPARSRNTTRTIFQQQRRSSSPSDTPSLSFRQMLAKKMRAHTHTHQPSYGCITKLRMSLRILRLWARAVKGTVISTFTKLHHAASRLFSSLQQLCSHAPVCLTASPARTL